jgi:predicted DNA-binding protein
MSTTSIKMTDKLKARATAAAKREGKTTHAFLVEAIKRATDVAEMRARFIAEATEAREKMIRSGKGFVAEEVHAYFRERIAGRKASRPKARNWRG